MNRHPISFVRVAAPARAHGRLVTVLVAGLAAALFVSNRRRSARWPDPVRTETAVGDSTCISCHRDKASFEGTAHRLTMQRPSRATVAGHFGAGENVLRTPNPNLYFHMDADSAGFTQTAVLRNGRDSTTRTERFALRLGSPEGTELPLLGGQPIVSAARVVLGEPRASGSTARGTSTAA